MRDVARIEMKPPVAIINEDEIVAGSVHFGEIQHRRFLPQD
jgi:hypothetical protein